jgi:hypothetical protein
MLTRAASFALAVASMALTGCGSSDEPPPESLSVVLGTGQAQFELMDGEPELTLVAGIQGGFHVWASFLAYGFSAPTIGMVLTTDVDGVSSTRIPQRANLTTRETIDTEGNSARTFAGFPAQVYDARCANGRRVRLDIRLTDADGRFAEDTRYCIASVPEALRSSSCD